MFFGPVGCVNGLPSWGPLLQEVEREKPIPAIRQISCSKKSAAHFFCNDSHNALAFAACARAKTLAPSGLAPAARTLARAV